MGSSLPVDALREPFRQACLRSNRLILEAPTGSGKSTRLPQFLLDDGLVAADKEIVVLQPRRLPARMLARFISQQRGGGPPGGEVGYQVRFENVTSAATRLRFVTEALLLRQIQSDPTLAHVGAVLFDEFHERHLATDLSLAMLRSLQETRRPDLRLIVTSATLDSQQLAEWLTPCEVLKSSGRSYPVTIRYSGNHSVPAWEQAARQAATLMEQHPLGDLLIFMPGMFEIQRTLQALQQQPQTRTYQCLPLYGDLQVEAQDRALQQGSQRRIIVATNVAETSLTIPGIQLVIDSGLAKVARYDPIRGIDTLLVEKISQASADQRSGRAGRTAPGFCLRLWSETDHVYRAPAETPEIHRVDLAEALLLLASCGYSDPQHFPWIEPPAAAALARAQSLLHDLGAIQHDGQLTATGQQLAQFPLHPRFGRMLLEADRAGCVTQAADIAAIAQGRSLLTRSPDPAVEKRQQTWQDNASSDFLLHLQALNTARKHNFNPQQCRDWGIHALGARQADLVSRQLVSVARQQGLDLRSNHCPPDHLRKCILAAFSDQLALRLDKGTLRCRMIHNRSGELRRTSVVRDAPLFVAAEISETNQQSGVVTLLGMATAIEEDWLREIFPADFKIDRTTVFDSLQKRIITRQQTLFRDLVLEEKLSDSTDLDAAATLFTDAILDGSIRLRQWDESLQTLQNRINCAAQHFPELEISPIDAAATRLILEQFCHGALSVRELQQRSLHDAFLGWLSAEQQLALATFVPESLQLPAKKRPTRLRYEDDGNVILAATVQELYDATPERIALGGGRLSPRIEILAPNRRPIQITDDLERFWESSYHQVKKDLKGRYPKHEWR